MDNKQVTYSSLPEEIANDNTIRTFKIKNLEDKVLAYFERKPTPQDIETVLGPGELKPGHYCGEWENKTEEYLISHKEERPKIHRERKPKLTEEEKKAMDYKELEKAQQLLAELMTGRRL